MKAEAALPRKPGRPLSFDRAAALEQAMLAFWRHGYETTSISDLTAAMGITAPSLYTAFGDKKRLFLEAMQLYAGSQDDLLRRLDQAATARDAAHDMMRTAARAFTGSATPRGCLLASATASGSAEAADVQAAVAEVRHGILRCLEGRIARDIEAGVLPRSASAADLATLVITLIQGMSLLARDGVDLVALDKMIDVAMAAWPAPHGA